MGTTDLVIVVLYLIFISWWGLRIKHDQKTTEDFFLADRTLSWPFIGLSLFATNISSSSIIGLASSGYETGISVFNYEWIGAVMLVFFAIFIIPFYLRTRLTTMPEFLERRFDSRSRIYFSVISIIANVTIDIAGALYASSLFLKGLFPSIDLYIFVLIMAVIAGLYTILGGLRAVIATDTIQAVLLTVGPAVVAYSVFSEFSSWQEFRSLVQPELISLIRPADDPFIPWPTLIVSLPILGFYFMCSNQHMVQRILGAQSIDDARKGAILAGFLKIPLLFFLILPATMGTVLFPDLSTPNLIYPELMFEFLPPGVLGLVLTGFVAALMSSIDSALTASSSIATLDIYKTFFPERKETHLIKTGKVFILIFVLFASVWAPLIEQFPTLWEYLQAVLSYLSPPIVTCFVFGLFWNKASSDSAFYTLIAGSGIAILLVINNYFLEIIGPIHYLYSSTIIFLFSSVVMIAFSLHQFNKGMPVQEHPEISLVYKKSESPDLPWYKSYKLYALILCLLIAAIVITFR